MSATATWHIVCDTCGKRADIEAIHPNQDLVPEGWSGDRFTRDTWGDYCSEACLRAALVAKAVERAAQAFAPKEAEAVP